MNLHPMFGYRDEDCDLTSPLSYRSAVLPFGEATSLPPFAFRSKRFADLEDEKVWTRTWVCVGYQDRIPKPGDLLSHTVGNHGIHIQRQPDQGLVGRFNFAQHGGCRFVPQQCQTGKKTKCYYTACGHSRDRDVIPADESSGETREMGQYLGPDPSRLMGIKVDTWGPFVFANLDFETSRLRECLGNLDVGTNSYFKNSITHVSRHTIEVGCNWKIAGELFLKGYYLFPAEKRIKHESVEVTEHRDIPENQSYWFFAINLATGKRVQVDQIQSLGSLKRLLSDKEHAVYCWVYPNLLLSFFPDHLVSTLLQPTSMTTCIQHTDIFTVGKNSSAYIDEQLSNFWAAARREEASLAEATQKAYTGFQAHSAVSEVGNTNDVKSIETNILAYGFQSYFLKQLLTSHTYYMNKPLYSAPGRALNAGR